MAQLGRFDYHVQDTLGNALFGASVTVYKEGATVNGNQSGTTPLAVTVRHAGKIATGDAVFVNTTTGTTYTATRTSATVITLSGFVGTLSLSNGDRLIPSTSQPTLYGDDQAGATVSNPLTTSATGRANCWMEYGAYDNVVSGAGITTTTFTSQVMPIETQPTGYVNVKAFGAKGDNSTDDSTAIAAALAEAAEAAGNSAGCLVSFPKGRYLTNSQIVVPNKVVIQGSGRSSTYITAGASFPINTPVVRLGQGTGIVFGCRLENLTVECSQITGCRGIYSNEIQEESGASKVVIANFDTYGIHLETSTTTPTNFMFNDIECNTVRAAATNVVGIFADNTRGGRFERITTNADNGVAQLAGIHIKNAGTLGISVIENLHSECFGDCLRVEGSLARVHASNVTHGGSLAATNVVNIISSASGGHVFEHLFATNVTNLLNNQVTGLVETITGGVGKDTLAYYAQVARNSILKVFKFTDQVTMVQGSDAPITGIRATPTSGATSRSHFYFLDGNDDGWSLRFGADGANDPFQLLPITAGVVGSVAWQVEDTGPVTVTSYEQFPEISDPAAPATNNGRLYVRDNGAGKSQLVIRFPTGAIQVIATEP